MNSPLTTVIRGMKPLFLLIMLATLTIQPKMAFADRYDDEYAKEQSIKRLAERIDSEEQAGREAAKARYDAEHSSSSSNDGEAAGVIIACFAFLVGFFYCVYKFSCFVCCKH